jgi:RimJ/RimL family protein N-acetyltransferase
MPGPVVEEGERVALRAVERDDAAFLQRSNTDPRVRFPLGSFVHGNRAERRDQIAEDTEADGTRGFVVYLDDEDAPRGHPEGATTPIGDVPVQVRRIYRPSTGGTGGNHILAGKEISTEILIPRDLVVTAGGGKNICIFVPVQV